ncbi:SPOR domain-containing protein [Rhodanobacter sp. 7MK24]|uniref:SPOR domain-containing protein n=1 Tax=Rhodanobacter sp. 7MK24 TaxID=2775922 RepID=UPI00177F8757|nr:SPOR domain-containing protein [Rhodanobacter sp. 7MK24]MBD8879605.1 SPOR domain-containing protein [Rhodanobacter sp. 7MK24]
MKTRLLGAFVLVALLVIFVPMFFSSNPSSAPAGDQSVSLTIPPVQDSNLQTRTMSLAPGAPAASGTAAPVANAASAATTAQASASSSQLASVDIPSNRPTDVGTDAAAPKAQPNGPTMGSGASPSQPVIPLQGGSSGVSKGAVAAGAAMTGAAVVAAATHDSSPTKSPVAAPVAATPAATPPAPSAAADRSIYVLNLSAYANADSVDRLVRRVRGFGYPVLTRIITQAGKQLTLVTAGPFDSRTSAEAARLKITQAIPSVPAKLVEGLGHADSNIASAPVATTMAANAPRTAAVAASPTTAAAAPRTGGYAVQLAAMGSQADANALRDKLRAAGFDGYVDTVSVNGKQLWRVRAGPQTQRADAERVRDQIQAKLSVGGNVVRVP